MFCFKITILVFCFTLGANLALGSVKDDIIIAKDPGNVLELSNDSGMTQNNILSRVSRAVPNTQSSDDQVDVNGDGDDVNAEPSRRFFKPVEDIIKTMKAAGEFLKNLGDKKE